MKECKNARMQEEVQVELLNSHKWVAVMKNHADVRCTPTGENIDCSTTNKEWKKKKTAQTQDSAKYVIQQDLYNRL